jgi:dTDP-4-amino-4,6-dideoxygalactose transaminase
MTDIQAALGIHQLRRLDGFIRRRQEIAATYREAFSDLPELLLPKKLPGRNHVYHLDPVQLDVERLRIDRAQFIGELQKARIGASVHFIPLHRHPFYRQLGYEPADFPSAERIYRGLLSLPLYPKMSADDVADVTAAVREIVLANRV